MAQTVREVLDRSITLELKVAQVYRSFAELFPQDHSFWWQLAIEEDNHASLLRSGRDFYLDNGLFPEAMVCRSIAELDQAIQEIDRYMEASQETPPDLQAALEFALSLEMSAGEIHYQNFMQRPPQTGSEDVFQQLNRDDKDHAARISIYMQKKGFPKKEV